MMRRLLVLTVVSTVHLLAQSYFPEVGPQAVYQRSLDLRSRLHVLSIALQPGFEDLSALAYFRLGRGAKIISAYLTNGEAGESDLRGEYPHQLAVVRREEAANALQLLGGETYYLNLPDLAAASDTAQIRRQWQRDTVQLRLMELIATVRPDIILIAADRESRGESLRWELFWQDVRAATERLAPGTNRRVIKELPPLPLWSVSRLLLEDRSGKGSAFAVDDVHPVWKKSYAAIGAEAAQHYASLAFQRALWGGEKEKRYRVVRPRGLTNLRRPDQGLPLAVSADLAPIAQQIDALTRPLLRQPASLSIPGRTSNTLTLLADLLDTVELRLARSFESQTAERKVLLQWKEGLENLRLALLGVTVRYTAAETILTDRQLTYLRVDTVTGISSTGKTEILFPSVGRGWILNESLENRLPLTLKQDYRLLVQDAKPYTMPAWQYGLEEHRVVRPFYLFIIHKAARREENFVYRTTVPFQYAPRFSVEVLTPIVLAVPNERLVVRLTNHSRDGVRDTLHANDVSVVSSRHVFRLNQKGSSQTDTLLLSWSSALPMGTHLLPLKIGEDTVGQYVVRKFPIRVDTTKRIGMIVGVASSPTLDAVRRLGLAVQVLNPASVPVSRLDSIDLLLIDQRTLTFHPNLSEQVKAIEDFVRAGGHLVVLAQDDLVWNARPLMDGLMLKRSLSFGPNSTLQMDSLHAVFRTPNDLANEDWSEWLYRLAYNELRVDPEEGWEVLVTARSTGSPLVVSKQAGRGRFTYVDVDLQHQWMNIHAGALRLLANIIAQ